MSDTGKAQVAAVKKEPAEAAIARVAEAPQSTEPKSAEVAKWIAFVNSGRNRRAWLLLGERCFSHPRYALLVLAALVLCALEPPLLILLPLTLFFLGEWGLRLWLQKENGWRSRTEIAYLMLDGAATLSLLSLMILPLPVLQYGFYFRFARLLRGFYLLRMLRIFHFLTHDTLIYSLPFALAILVLGGLALALPSIALYIGVLLLLEVAVRIVACNKVLAKRPRRKAELAFAGVDIFASLALLGLIPWLSPFWVLLRLLRFFVMLNPVINLAGSVKKVLSMPAVRSESSMLVAMLAVMVLLGSMAVIYLYPAMDINDDSATDGGDKAPFQIILFVFRLLMDPGTAPPEAFSPWLVGLTIVLVLSGVFLFALIVGLGANVMNLLLIELSNSSLSAREQLLFAGGNEQSLPILRQFGRLCARSRRSISSVWLFFGEPLLPARSVGRWLTVRQAEPGEREMITRFQLSGVRQLYIFHRGDELISQQEVVDMHHLHRDLSQHNLSSTLVVADAALPLNVAQMYQDSLSVTALDSAAVAARMLYQMHHCAHMPALGIRLLDVVEGEVGLFACAWEMQLIIDSGHVMVRFDGRTLDLEAWLCACFDAGINLMAAVDENAMPVLFSDLLSIEQQHSFSHVIGIGRNPALWASTMQKVHQHSVAEGHVLRAFSWPETWDLHMIFLGWHEGLPAMISEMILNHHKLMIHVFSTADANQLTRTHLMLQKIASQASEHGCNMNASVHAWDGLDTAPLVEQLRGCKVMMFYPEEVVGGSEDSVLELWYHEVSLMLSARKQKARWWTPPKLMVLPRQGENIAALVTASYQYEQLETHVGSPDAFHDLFVARRMLNEADRALASDMSLLDDHVFRFVDEMLSDRVLIESVATERMIIEATLPAWADIYRQSLHRGWLLVGYLTAPSPQQGICMYDLLDGVFPEQNNAYSSGMHLLGGAMPVEMDDVCESVELLYCRRGVLKQAKAAAPTVGNVFVPAVSEKDNIDEKETSLFKKGAPLNKVDSGQQQEAVTNSNSSKISAQAQPAKADKSRAPVKDKKQLEKTALVQTKHPAVAETRQPAAQQSALSAPLEGEVMAVSVWPQEADGSLLKVLEKQVEGSLTLLQASSEKGLMTLSSILEMGVSSEVETLIMEALMSLQNFDRVSQRMTNVQSCLQDWGSATPATPTARLWQDSLINRYVMEEERQTLKEALSDVHVLPVIALSTHTQTDMALPVEAALEAVVPETTLSEVTVPETTLSEATVAKTTVSEATVPETKVPEVTVPEVTLSEVTVSEATLSEVTVAATTVPETTLLEATVPAVHIANSKQEPSKAEADRAHELRTCIGAHEEHEIARVEVIASEVLEGEVMDESVWPKVADKRLLKVLEKQVEGSLELLESSSEGGLVKLSEILDMGVGEEIEGLIMQALTDLQNVDRVMQRLHNVRSCLQDWGTAVPQAPASVAWKESVEKRYVMEEERDILKGEL
ncbi:MAG: hypothetical protein Q9M31_08810 [Mariprofundus sp.]|nr:hypothetical protein [Mariprofundus sp.]